MRSALFSGMLFTALAVGCAKKPSVAPASPPPTTEQPKLPRTNELLLQPQPVWKDQAPSFNGTAFFLKSAGHTFVMTTGHYFSSQVHAVNLWSMQGEPLFQSRYSLWGYEEGGVDGAIQDLSEDIVAMAVPSMPQGYVALEPDLRHYIAPGERVWLPNKQEGNPGHQRVEGRITDWDPGFVDIELDHPVQFHSQSGSPVISSTSGKVIGLVSRVGGTNQIRLAPLWMMAQVMALLSSQSQKSLTSDKKPQRSTEKVTPRFHWPEASWPLITIQLQRDKVHRSRQHLTVRPTEDGRLSITSNAGDMPIYSLSLAQDGSDVTPLEFTNDFREVVKRVNHFDDADADGYLDYFSQIKRGMFRNFSSNWTGQTMTIGADYTRDLSVDLAGVPATLKEVFQATKVGGCEREVMRRCVKIKLRRQYGAAEIARVQAELGLRGSKLQVADVRYLATVQFELDGMIPHAFSVVDVADGAPEQTVMTFSVIDHPEAPAKVSPGVGSPEHPDARASLPKKQRIPPAAPLYGGTLASQRANARPLMMHGPGPETNMVPTPSGAQDMVYSSGALQLGGWLARPNKTGALPLVVYLHAGFSRTQDDWSAATQFLNQGYAVFVPQLRGETPSSGEYSAFFHEVEDAIAAGNAAAGLPGVDPKRIYLAGRDTGGTLALLVAELPNPFAGVGAIEPVNTTRFAFAHPLEMPFDTADVRELALRDPLRFAGELKSKAVLLAGSEPAAEAHAFCAEAPSGRCEVRELKADSASNAQTLITTW